MVKVFYLLLNVLATKNVFKKIRLILIEIFYYSLNEFYNDKGIFITALIPDLIFVKISSTFNKESRLSSRHFTK